MKLPAAGLIAAMALLAGCNDSAPDAQVTNRENASPVRAALVEQVEVANKVHAAGLLTPRDEVRLAFKTGGVVDRVTVEAGDRVVKGQPLASLKSTEVGAAVEQATASLDKARRDLERAKQLRADEVATEEQVEDLATAYQVARANVDSARFNARFARIEAPGDGVVLQRLVEENELVQGGQPVLVIGTTGSGWVVRAALADRDLVRVNLGDPVDIAFDAFPGRVFPGRVSRIASASDPQTGTFEIEIDVAADGARFVRGLVAKVTLALADTGLGGLHTVVPVTALVEANGPEATVFVVDRDAGVARRRQVAIGPLFGERVIVTSGLDAGERVVTDGATWLSDGKAVRLVGERG